MEDLYKDRRFIVQAMIILFTIAMLLKLVELQLWDTSYVAKANATVMQKLTLYPSRGMIYDRKGHLLVNNNAMYDLMATYNQVKDIDTAKFCALLDIDKATFEKNLNKDFSSRQFAKWVPFVFLKKISAQSYARFQESMYEFPGFFVQLRNVRGYPYHCGAHVMGYISEVSSKQIAKSEGYYERGDYIGMSGLEQAYEQQLRGRRGYEYVLRDNMGRIEGSFQKGNRDDPAISGKDLISTLDIDLQLYGELLMKNKKGSIVAIEPSTGEILALVSSPSYDPNMLAINRYRGSAFKHLQQDSLKPFFNRALMAQYPPGSVFKPIIGLIAMQENVTHQERAISCRGGYIYKNLRVGCHGHPTCTSVGMAIQHSCNAYFCQLFRDVVDKYGYDKPDKGLDMLNEHLKDFGLGHTLEIDIPNELSGNIPSSAYYNKMYPKSQGGWKSPTIISMGIGQGEVLLTPLQIANLATIIANKGYYYPPHLAKAFYKDTAQIPEKYLEKRYTRIDTQYFRPVIDGMEQVVLNGTARIARIDSIDVCGKTGTSQNPHGEDHSVFFAFAPKDKPQIAIAVFVENSGYGARYAAPISSLMIEKYLNKKISKKRQYLEDRMTSANLINNTK